MRRLRVLFVQKSNDVLLTHMFLKICYVSCTDQAHNLGTVGSLRLAMQQKHFDFPLATNHNRITQSKKTASPAQACDISKKEIIAVSSDVDSPSQKKNHPHTLENELGIKDEM